MRMRRVPRHLQVKVIKWFDYLWFTQKSSDEEKSVGGLPGKSNFFFFFFLNKNGRVFCKNDISSTKWAMSICTECEKGRKEEDKGSEYKHQYLHCGLRTAARFPFTSIAAVDRDPKKDWRHITRPLDLYYSGDLFE